MSPLTLAKDWIYVFCTVIQTLIALVAVIAVNWFWKTKERREDRERRDKLDKETEDREERERKAQSDREERIEKEKVAQLSRVEREKIAQLLSKEYEEIEQTFEEMKKYVNDLKETPIIIEPSAESSRTVWSAFDILKYMYQPDKQDQFKTHALDQFRPYVAKIVRLFRNFRIKLPPMVPGRPCPENIKEELGRIIIEIGNLIFPLVDVGKQRTIIEVLKYFDAAPSTSPDITNLKNYLPYIDHFRFEDDKKITFDKSKLKELSSHILNIAKLVEEKNIDILNRTDEITGKLKQFLDDKSSFFENYQVPPYLFYSESTGTNILHLIRLVIDVLCKDQNLRNDSAFIQLMEYFKGLNPSLSTEEQRRRYTNCIDDIFTTVNNLNNPTIVPLTETIESEIMFLQQIYKDLNDFVIRTPRHSNV